MPKVSQARRVFDRRGASADCNKSTIIKYSLGIVSKKYQYRRNAQLSLEIISRKSQFAWVVWSRAIDYNREF